MPLGDGLTQALALVHLAQGLPGPVSAQGMAEARAGGFDMARFLADFLPLGDAAKPGGLRLGLVDAPVAARARVLAIDARLGLGNGRQRPAGPLLHAPSALFAWADAVLLIGPEARRHSFLDTAAQMGWALPPVHAAEIRALQMGMDWAGAAILAFSAGGFAETLFQACRAEGANLRAAIALPQAEVPGPALLRRLQADALRLGAQLVTTEADAQSLPPAFRPEVLAMPLRLSGAEGLATQMMAKLSEV